MRKAAAARAEHAELWSWIQAFVGSKPLSSPTKPLEWIAWARRKLDSGWTADQVRSRIRQAWTEWLAAGFAQEATVESKSLTEGLQSVFRMANEGLPPATCAHAYRILAKQHPEASAMLNAYADAWDARGQTWLDDSTQPVAASG